MTEKLTKVGNKLAQLREPFIAPVTDIVGRVNEIRGILAAWMAGVDILPLSPLLLGDPGLGKNRIVYECARICSKDLYIFQGHEDVGAEDLVCAVRFSDDPNKKMDYIVSELVTAMLRGGICFIDEIAKIRPRALAPLASLLDERRYLDSIVLGERIYAHPGFRFVAASNTTDLEAALLPDFIRSRMRPVITVRYPDRDEIDRILRSRYSILRKNGKKLLDCFWGLWKDSHGDKPPSPRDFIDTFAFALSLANSEKTKIKKPFILEHPGSLCTIRKEHIEKAFEQRFYIYGKGKHVSESHKFAIPRQ